MNTIILTSSGFLRPIIREELLKILPKRRPLKVAYISTASKVVKEDVYAQNDVFIMTALGMEVTEIDLAEVKQKKLAKLLNGKDIIYVQGGNGYYLLKQVKESGFDKLIKPLIEQGLIYIGKSAGSYIACPTIEMHKWFDTKWDKFGLTDLTALNLVPFLLTAHYTEDRRETLEKVILQTKFPVRAITNDQALLIKDDKVQLIGKGEEIRF